MLRARQEASIGERVRVEGGRRRVHCRNNKKRELSLRERAKEKCSSDC